MEIVQALVLGIVQGVTEFLPISSSGHLALVPWLLGWKDPGTAFDAALHLGTLTAIIWFFWKDWLDILGRWREPPLRLIILGCIPAAVAGLLFEKQFETIFRSPVIIGFFMIFMGLLLWLAEITGRKKRDLGSINIVDACIIGAAQTLALMPGVSRSGITMTAGLFNGLSRETSARFSFLLATPIILAAGVYKLKDLSALGQESPAVIAAGIIASAVFGFLSIRFLLNYLKNNSFAVFIWYRLLFGAAVIFLAMMR